MHTSIIRVEEHCIKRKVLMRSERERERETFLCRRERRFSRKSDCSRSSPASCSICRRSATSCVACLDFFSSEASFSLSRLRRSSTFKVSRSGAGA